MALKKKTDTKAKPRTTVKKKTAARPKKGTKAGKKLTIKVCRGTGGIAAGSEDVINEFSKQLKAHGIKADIVKKCVNKTGCRGFCAKDVLVEVNLNEENSVYQLITVDKVSRIVEEHIMGGDPVDKWLVGPDYHAFHDKQTKILLKQCGQIDPEDINAYL